MESVVGNFMGNVARQILEHTVDAQSYLYNYSLVSPASALIDIRTSDVRAIQLIAGGYYRAYSPQIISSIFFSPPHEDEGHLGLKINQFFCH